MARKRPPLRPLDRAAVASLRAIRTSGEVPLPNFVLDTSPERNQVVWRVDGLDREQAEALLHSLAAQFRGDRAATDISRVLRMPGFQNNKYHQHFMVRAVQESDATYYLRDFAIAEGSPDAPRQISRGYEAARLTAFGHKSQSESDWAFAKRALARGDSPEDVIRRIADYRAEDKADPVYYARLTVSKAQASLQRLRTDEIATTQSVELEEKQR